MNSSAAVYGTQRRHREHDDSQQRRSQRDSDSVEQPSSVQDPGYILSRKQDAQNIASVYDVTDKESFNHVKDPMGEINKHASDGVNKLLIENKCDPTSQEELSTDEAKERADSLDMRRAIRVKRAIRVRRD